MASADKAVVPFADEVRRNHLSLSEASAAFLAFVERHPACRDRTTFAYLDEVPKGLVTYRLQSWPTLASRERVAELGDAARAVVNLIRSVPRRFFDNDPSRLAAWAGQPGSFDREASPVADMGAIYAAALSASNDAASTIGRCDFIQTADGFQCLEFNPGVSGGFQAAVMANQLLAVPMISRFIRESGIEVRFHDTLKIALRYFADDCVRRLSSLEEVNVGVEVERAALEIGHMEHFETDAAIELMFGYVNMQYEDVLRARGGPNGQVMYVPSDEIGGGAPGLFHKGRRLHAVVDAGWAPRTDAIVRSALEARSVCLYNGPLTWLLGDKRFLGILSSQERRGALPSADAEVVRRHVPWSAVVGEVVDTYRGQEIRLPEFILRNRENLVLKAGRSAEGRDVILGEYVTADSWEDATRHALQRGDWMVQERVHSVPYYYQAGEHGCEEHQLVLSPFVIGDQYGGGHVRSQPMRSAGPINSALGADVGLILEVQR